MIKKNPTIKNTAGFHKIEISSKGQAKLPEQAHTFW
jgi:hypothetical protein